MDIGSNSFRLLVAEVEDGRLRPLIQDLVTVRLGDGLWASGLLAPAAMLRGEAALVRFVEKMAPYLLHVIDHEVSPQGSNNHGISGHTVPQVAASGTAMRTFVREPDRSQQDVVPCGRLPLHSVRVCTTHAVRQAANSQDFLSRAEALVGLPIEVLSGEEEARLALLGALSALPEEQLREPLLLADVGGGSTEIILQDAIGSESRLISLPLGAVGLSEEFGADRQAMREKIRETLTPALRSIGGENTVGQGLSLVACGGTATSLAALALGLERYDARQVQNYLLHQPALHRLVAWLAALSPAERNILPGLADGRGEIIVAGALILQELQQALASPPLLVSDAGLLEGILLSGATDC